MSPAVIHCQFCLSGIRENDAVTGQEILRNQGKRIAHSSSLIRNPEERRAEQRITITSSTSPSGLVKISED